MRQWKKLVEEKFVQPKLRTIKSFWPTLTANKITLFRLLPAIFAFWLFPVVLYATAAILDWVDGAWARANKEEGPVGKFLDPAVDKAIVLSWLWVLWSQGTLPLYLVVTMTGLDAISQAAYGQKILKKAGANIFGQSKKVLQDSCVLSGIAMADKGDWASLLLIFSAGAALLSLGAKFQLKKTSELLPT